MSPALQAEGLGCGAVWTWTRTWPTSLCPCGFRVLPFRVRRDPQQWVRVCVPWGERVKVWEGRLCPLAHAAFQLPLPFFCKKTVRFSPVWEDARCCFVPSALWCVTRRPCCSMVGALLPPVMGPGSQERPCECGGFQPALTSGKQVLFCAQDTQSPVVCFVYRITKR